MWGEPGNGELWSGSLHVAVSAVRSICKTRRHHMGEMIFYWVSPYCLFIHSKSTKRKLMNWTWRLALMWRFVSLSLACAYKAFWSPAWTWRNSWDWAKNLGLPTIQQMEGAVATLSLMFLSPGKLLAIDAVIVGTLKFSSAYHIVANQLLAKNTICLACCWTPWGTRLGCERAGDKYNK